MAIIKADDPLIEKELLRLEELVTDGGGGVHSDMVIVAENGGLSVQTREPMANGREIIRLSRDVLLPSDKYQIGVKGDEFTIEFADKSGFSDLQRELGETMITLYNLTHKVKMQREYSFLLSLAPYPELVDFIDSGRMFGANLNEWRPKVHKGLEGEELNRFLSETFLKTRHLGYADYIRTSSISILMPIIDFINHNWNGANFGSGVGVRQGDLTVNTAYPFAGSLECYAFYNIMDSLDALLRYDFIDESAPVVRSVPIDLQAGDHGLIVVKSWPGAGGKKNLATAIADLSRYLPTMTVDRQKKTLNASHLMIPVGASPLALRRVLYLLLVNLTGKVVEKTFSERWIREAEHKIVEKNKAHYKDMLALIDKLTKERGGGPGLERMRGLCNLQLEKLAAYKMMETAEDMSDLQADIAD